MASRYCRFASKYCRMAGVAPAGSLDAGGEDIGRESPQLYIADLRMKLDDWEMVILALDTSSAEGSAAAIRAGGDRAVTIERAGDATRHARRRACRSS